ncbi:helix-turn-helix transcriptional regulator [Holdemanella biformis]|uniref:helix-turn-helix domain-containing protein n=1 Tax=Holdemanella biformis TaxID=1735 RepID=UPI0024926231|nr:helix-turn-helix transcriptional regulator [Holdemanella biformis]
MLENTNKFLIGNILKSIRVEKDIPIKRISSALKVSESTISQIETGKNKPAKEKITVISQICGYSFDYEIDREKIIGLVQLIYTQYTNLEKEKLNLTIGKIKSSISIQCSYARFEYYLILYMDVIINQKNEDVQFLKKILEIGKSTFSVKELSIYYDIQALEMMYLNDNIKALEYLDKSRLYDNESLMNHYHYCSIYLNLGYYTLAQQYIIKCIDIAVKEVSFERLCYLILNQGVLYLNTSQYNESIVLNLKLLEESKKRNNAILEFCVLANLTLSSLMQKDFKLGFKYLEMIDQKYKNEDSDLVLYQIMLYFFSKDFISAKKVIRKALSNDNISKYYQNFFHGIKYLMDNKFIKAIELVEKCYTLALKDGEVDRAMLDLKFLDVLYSKYELQDKLKRVKEIEENFYKISYSNCVLENIDLKLN